MKEDKILQLINNLTNDDDLRQELWLHYLSGNHPSSFTSHLQKIKLESSQYQKLQETIWQFITNDDPTAEQVVDIVNQLTDLERSIVALLMIGVSVEHISRYKAISPIRINQAISAIRNNTNWEKIWHSNDRSQTKKDTD